MSRPGLRRILNRLSRAPRVHHQLAFDNKGVRLVSDWNDGTHRDAEFDWTDVIQVAAYKKDCFAVDLICTEFLLISEASLEINEEMVGWEELMTKLPEYLPGCRSFDAWFLPVAQPAFAPNYTVLFRRNDQPQGLSAEC